MAIPFIPVVIAVATNPATQFVVRAAAGGAIGAGVGYVAQKLITRRRINKFKKELNKEFEKANWYDSEKTFDSTDYKEV